MHRINIYCNQKVIASKIDIQYLKKILQNILKKEHQPETALNFILVDNKEIRGLNRKYLGKNTITDVIAFPLSDKKGMPTDNINGEIVISVEEALRQSHLRNIPLKDEILLYCIHGLLHLIGYDDLTPKKRLKMEQKQLYYLSRPKRISAPGRNLK
ncbi:MAG: rRNA maturation RNase YbeY [Planctomycetota bacterium]